MIKLSLEQCLEPLAAQLVAAGESQDLQFEGVSIDTRTLKRGELYIAIVGENFDGHAFCAEAESLGAAALLVSQDVDSSLPQLRVSDTRVAMAALAHYWRAMHDIPVIGITGSNGKTTVKELVTAILSQQGEVLSTKGNLNNELGVPLTLFRLGRHHQYAVVEMGANHLGEIATLCDIAKPDIGLITSIGGVHLEGFGSIEGVVQGKTELFAALTGNGYACVNLDDAYASDLQQAASHCNQLGFGQNADATIQGGPGPGLSITIEQAVLEPRFALLGEHNRLNALAAVAVAVTLHVPHQAIVAGLESVLPVPGRLVSMPAENGATLIDDSYNANPVSACAAIDVLMERSGQCHFALGDMAELGDTAAELHEQVGEHAAMRGVHGFWSVGPLAGLAQSMFVSKSHKDVSGGQFDSQQALVDSLRPRLQSDSTVLVKGSRSAAMENVVNALLDGGSA